MNSFPKCGSGWRRTVALALCVLLTNCVGLSKRDAFPVPGDVPGTAALQKLVEAGVVVRPLAVSANGRTVRTYYAQHAGAKGVLIFFGGSGNEAEAPLKVIGPRAAGLGLDLVVFSYYLPGETVPSVTQARAEARAVCAAVRNLGTPASKSVYLLGHSLGGWFALDAAASETLKGLALAGAETTAAEVIRKTNAPWASLVAIRPDEDAKQLDASLYAPRVRARTLVVTSRQDEAVPASVGREVYEMIPATTPKKLVVLEGVTHGRYFLSDEFWRQYAEFFGLAPQTTAKAR